jgi:DNA-binding NarL/FixJ family response regulator
MAPAIAAPRLLVADHAPTRLAVRASIEDAAQICAEAGDAGEAIAMAEREQPEICIVGLELPGGGIVAVHGIRAVAPSSAVLVLATGTNADQMLAAVRAGAIGYLQANIEPGALRRVLAGVALGEAALPRTMVLELALEVRETSTRRRHGLTGREAEVLDMVRCGLSTAMIANRLSISPVTVRRHISTAVRKVGASGRVALAERSEAVGQTA